MFVELKPHKPQDVFIPRTDYNLLYRIINALNSYLVCRFDVGVTEITFSLGKVDYLESTGITELDVPRFRNAQEALRDYGISGIPDGAFKTMLKELIVVYRLAGWSGVYFKLPHTAKSWLDIELTFSLVPK